MVAVGLAGGQTPAAEKRRAWWHVEVTGRSGDGKREREAVCGGILAPVWAGLRRAEYVEVQNDPASPSHPIPARRTASTYQTALFFLFTEYSEC
jgi:hypothetical protein